MSKIETGMKTYHALGFLISSEVEFPELPIKEGPADLQLRLVAEISEAPDETEYRVLRTDDDSLWCSFWSGAERYRIVFGIGLVFQIRPATGEVELAITDSAVAEETVRHLFLHHIVPYVASLRGQYILHACGVEIGGRGVAFAGESGAGKSTTSMAFARSGHRLLSDDMLPIRQEGDQYYASPSLPYVRMKDDSIGHFRIDPRTASENVDWLQKRHVLSSGQFTFSANEVPLTCIYFLSKDEIQSLELRALAPSDAFFRLVRSTVLLEMREKKALREYFERLHRMVDSVPMFEARFPRTYLDLPTVVAAIQEHQEKLSGTK